MRIRDILRIVGTLRASRSTSNELSSKRSLRFEALEERALLSVGTVDPTAPGDPDALPSFDADELAASDWSIIPGEVLVGVRTNTRTPDTPALAQAVRWPASIGAVDAGNVEEIFTIPQGPGDFLTVLKIRLRAQIGVREAVAELDKSGAVQFAEPDWYRSPAARQSQPNDPEFDNDGQYFHEVIDTPGAWNTFQQRIPSEWGGEGVVIAVPDTGVDLDHPDLGRGVLFAVTSARLRHGRGVLQRHGALTLGDFYSGVTNTTYMASAL